LITASQTVINSSTTSPNQYFSVTSTQALPFLDGIFAVAFTLMAYSIPEDFRPGESGLAYLLVAIFSFLLGAIAVILFWFKKRRLIQIAGVLSTRQLVLGFLALLSIVAIPKMGALVVRYGQGVGSIWQWTAAQRVNSLYLGTLFLFDILILCFALSLRDQIPLRRGSMKLVDSLIGSQLLGFLILVGLTTLELLRNLWATSVHRRHLALNCPC
jgi:uncharacterized membrane protein